MMILYEISILPNRELQGKLPLIPLSAACLCTDEACELVCLFGVCVMTGVVREREGGRVYRLHRKMIND